MTFAKEMLKTKEILGGMGHEVKIPTDAQDISKGNHNHDDLDADYKHCIENDILRTHLKLVEESDAILVLNYDKNDIKGYIGTSSLMELGLAHYFYKKIFLLQSLPDRSKYRWTHEVKIMQPVVLDGDFSKIK